MSHEEEQVSVEIAVIGIAGRFPGAPNLDAFWENLSTGVESISFFSEQELLAAAIDPELVHDPLYVKARGVLDDIDLFDAGFFDLTPREAELLDPQQRLFLECAWEALEHAGYTPHSYDGAIGVYGGASASSYAGNLYAHKDLVRLVGSFPIMLGNSSDYLTTRVSYKLNLQGPSVNVQTACSTSLVAVHQACQSLLNYHCDLALAGGASITVPHRAGYLYQEGGISSPDGHCRAFDAQAQGFVGGNGVGIVVLKRLAEALADGDTIHAVIKGSAITNDGGLKAGFTAPSETGQAAAIMMAQAVTEIDPATISYIEAHGTGTALGDPIEIAALTQAFRAGTDARGFCAIGSVKTNIGHLDTASGIAGLIKTILALRHQAIPPSLHCAQPNPAIDWSRSPFYVNTELRPWLRTECARRAGVSSFGIGGTNAHVIVEEAPEPIVDPPTNDRPWHVVALSAKTAGALDAATANLIAHLRQHPDLRLADVAATLQLGRSGFSRRRMVVCSSVADTIAALVECDPQRVVTSTTDQRDRPVAFVFPGQGAQYVGMGRQLYAIEPVFRETVDYCAELLEPHLNCDLRDLIYPQPEQAASAAQTLDQTWLTQPALFVVEYALAQLWMAWGVQPEALLGHSIGEYVAACLAGVFALEDALPLVALRGRLMQRLPGGAMLAVPLSEHEIGSWLGPQLDLAAVNGPAQCVIAGPIEQVETLQQQLAEQGIDTRRLATTQAFHSAMVEPITGALIEALRRIDLNPPAMPYISNVTGTWITAAEATDPDYWAMQLRQTVRFNDGLELLLQEPEQVLLEVGPGQALAALARRHPAKAAQQVVLASLPRQRDQQPETAFVLQTLGHLWVNGVAVSWDGLYRGRVARRIPLPTYPFERQRYWIAPPKAPHQPAIPASEAHHLRSSALAATHPEEIMAHPPAIPTTTARRHPRLVSAIQSIVTGFIGSEIAAIDPYASLFELGFDSLLLIQFNHALQDEFGIRITLVQLIEEYTTIDQVATYLDQLLPPEIAMPAQELETSAAPPATPQRAQPSLAAAQPEPIPSLTPMVPPQPTAGSPESSSMTWLMAQQLQAITQLMAQQLDVFRQSTPGAGPVLSSEPKPAPLAAQQTATPVPVQQNGHGPERPAAQPDDSRRVQPAPFVPHRPLEISAGDTITAQQRQYLEQFVRRYNERTRESKRLTQRYRPRLADSRGTALFRRPWKEIVYPIVGRGSSGAMIWDVDGNRYVDVTMGFGVHLFGHSPRFIMDAIEAQLQIGVELGPQSYLAGEVAEAFCALTGMERVNFCNSGTEAVMGALRIARTITRRTKIACFAGSYHGWSDLTLARPLVKNGQLSSIPMAPGVSANTVSDVVVLDYDTPAALEYLRAHAHELAAVLVEPVQSRRPDCQPRSFLHELRAITAQAGTALIFDEMICGFRAHPGGAQAVFGVQADIATYGKVIAGGFPVGAIAGKAAWMDAFDGGMWSYGDDSYPTAEKTLFAGAFFKHPLTMAAMLSILNHLTHHGPALQDELNQRTARLSATLNSFFEQEQVPIQVVHFSSLFRFNIPHDARLMELFFYHLTLHGIYNWEGGNCFLSTAHTDDDLEQIVRAVQVSIAEMRAGGLLPTPSGPAPVPSRSLTLTAAVTAQTPAATEPVAAGSVPARQDLTDRYPRRPSSAAMEFSLYFFGNYPATFDPHKYDLLFAAGRFADTHEFSAIWLPERHFHSFGGFSPNPVVIAAALARETQRVQIRAGSVALPLHQPIRVAEDWAIVDNVSRGRVGISFASGWHPDDFALAPDAYEQRRSVMLEGIATVQQLWRGETITTRGGIGKPVPIQLFPQPMQPELPIWLTSAHHETFVRAGEMGFRVLTNLQDQTIDELAEKIAAYRAALAAHGYPPERGHVTVLLHTFIGADYTQAVELARHPFYDYLRSSLQLVGNKSKRQGQQLDLDRLSDGDLDRLLGDAYQRYLNGGALIGTPDSCAATVEQLHAIGVDELGCFIDFGVAPTTVLAHLPQLEALQARYRARSTAADPPVPTVAADPAQQIPLTDAQQSLWVLSHLGDDHASLYNESITLDLRGVLDIEALRQSLQFVVDRHESLRTTFSRDGDFQQIQPALMLPFLHTDLRALSATERETLRREIIAEESHQHFDLVLGPLIRVHLIDLAPDEHQLILTIHHLVTDGQSLGTVLSEMSACYAAIRGGQPYHLPPPLQFRDYVDWLARQQHGQGLAEAEAYWLQQFTAPLPTLELPLDRTRPPVQTYAGNRLTATVDATTTSALKQLAAQQDSTLFMVLLSCFNLLLHRLTQQSDVIVGTPIAGQRLMGNRPLTGYCLNLLPLRSRLSGDPSFIEYLRNVRRAMLGAFTYQYYSFGKLLQALKLPRDPSRAPLINALFAMEKVTGGLPMLDLTTSVARNPIIFTRFDLGLNVVESETDLQLECDYNSDLFDSATIERWLGYFKTLLAAIISNPQQRAAELPLLSAAEQYALLVEWNGPRLEYPTAGGIHRLIEAQTLRTPEAIAVVAGNGALTYAELNARANQLAHHLQALGVGPEVCVGICVEPSLEVIIGLLGILKAGGAYVPLDPAYPRERLAFMLKDSQSRVLLTQQRLLATLPTHSGYTLCLDRDWPEIARRPTAYRACQAQPDQLAYVIYTSGSTGVPKGVMVAHRGLANYLQWAVDVYRVAEGEGAPVHSSLGFDLTVTSLFTPLLCGRRVWLLPQAPHVEALTAALNAGPDHSLVKATPAHLDLLRHTLSAHTLSGQARVLVIGGEALRYDTLDFWRTHAAGTRLINEYGPTEAVVGCCIYEVLPGDPRDGLVPIGRPTANTQIYILDRYCQPVPIGVAGEIYLGGVQLARGYLYRPDLTAERFVPDPFVRGNRQGGARLYRTGDLARYRLDGTLEYLGRIDQQVKVRGYRIELGEIEAVLAQHPAVREAAVIAYAESDSAEKRLIAYVVEDQAASSANLASATDLDAGPLRADELREFLQARLPSYMIPFTFILLDALPWTPNGKIDRRALPAPELLRPEEQTPFAEPQTPVEQALAEMWCAVLNLKRIGIHDNFFALGGHSLLVTQILSRVRDRWAVQLPFHSLFASPTIAELAVMIDRYEDQPQLVAPIQPVGDIDHQRLIAELDELSDQDVDALLSSLIDADSSR